MSSPQAPVLSNPDATRIKRISALQTRTARQRHSRFLIEGPQALREAVAYQPELITDCYATAAAAERYADIWQAAQEAGLYTHLVTEAVSRTMSSDSQGLLGVATLPESTGTDALREAVTEARLVVVLAEAQDPGNAGTIIRTADAAGADAVILARGSVEATNPKVVRASAGSIFHLLVVSGVAFDDVVDALHEAGLGIIAADGHADASLTEAADLLSQPLAWVLGNEARGMTEQMREATDAVVSIPMYGKAESLNVAAAAAVCLYATAARHAHAAQE